jgi:hypothetical protein
LRTPTDGKIEIRNVIHRQAMEFGQLENGIVRNWIREMDIEIDQ